MNRTLSKLLTILIFCSLNVAYSKDYNDKIVLVNPIFIGTAKTFETSFDCRYIKDEDTDINYLFFETTYIEYWTNDLLNKKLREVNSIINLILVDSNELKSLEDSTFYENKNIVIIDQKTPCTDYAQLIAIKMKAFGDLLPTNSELIHDRIEFLDKQAGANAIVDDSFEAYFSRLQRKEIFALTKNWPPEESGTNYIDFSKQLFQESVSEYSLAEKQALKEIVFEIEEYTRRLNLPIYHKTPWRFIKVNNSIAGGFTHTRGTYIILSEQYLNRYINADTNIEDKKNIQQKLLRLLFHEKTHVLQRLYPGIFNLLYEKYWGYQRVHLDLSGLDIENQILNPDSDINPWVYSYNDDFYWINVSLKDSVTKPKMGIDFETKAYKMLDLNGVFKFAQDSEGKLVWYDISKIETLMKRFPENRGIDSPNEISAYLMEEFICNEIKKHDAVVQDTIISMKAQNDLDLWINEYLIAY